MVKRTLDLQPLDATFGAVVRDLDVRALDDETFDQLHAAWIDHALLIFPGQHLSQLEQDEFARRFGDLEFTAAAISNIGKSGRVHHDQASDLVKSLRGNEGWHHDSTYMPVQAKGAVVSAEIIPASGAPTGFADMTAAYEALDEDTKSMIQGLSAYHSLYYSQGRAGYLPTANADGGYDMYGYHDEEPSLRPLVKIHPVTGRPNLCIGRHAYGIPGMDPEASEALLDSLNEQACQPPRIYHHHWVEGDAVLWDNRRLMHQGYPFDMTQPRRIWHTRIAGDPTTELAANHASS
jgi:alpha-ketoglutarate-dependent taurine dioxygenase